jgi:hypothetical protein
MLVTFIDKVRAKGRWQERGQSTVEYATMLTVILVLTTILGFTSDWLRELFRLIARILALV